MTPRRLLSRDQGRPNFVRSPPRAVQFLPDIVVVTRSHERSVWAAIVGGTGAAAWAWYRGRERRQSAERLAAATLETLLNAVDANDEVTGLHMRRTASYALCLADALELSEVDRKKLERIALFHDIGKIHAALFDIVHDQTTLTPEERTRIATHPQRGAEVLAPLAAFYPELPEGVLAHHERWDGAGYPRGLQGQSIPFFARVVAIADTFDAITHSRRYHQGEGAERGSAIISEGRGTQFDPELVDLFTSPTVAADVQHTFERSRDADKNPTRPRRPRRAERRARSAESSVPDVQFRWRAASSVAPTHPESDSQNAGPG